MDYNSASSRHHNGSQAGHLFSFTERTHFTCNRQIDIRIGRWNLDGDNSMIFIYIYILGRQIVFDCVVDSTQYYKSRPFTGS